MLNCFLLAVLLWYRITSKLFCFIINNFSLAQNKYSFSFFSIHTVSKIVQVYLVVFHFVITFLILKLVNTKKMENTFTYMRRLLFFTAYLLEKFAKLKVHKTNTKNRTKPKFYKKKSKNKKTIAVLEEIPQRNTLL